MEKNWHLLLKPNNRLLEHQGERKEEKKGKASLVERALLSDAIMEGSRLKYEMLQYELMD